MLQSAEGLNINYIEPGLWGKAIDASPDAKYCCPSSSFQVDEKTYQVFLTSLLVGDSVKLAPDDTLREPPRKLDGTPYDSVEGEVGDSPVYMVYASRKALAKYLITYKIE